MYWNIGKNAENKTSTIRKLTSKRELAVDEIKRYILTDGFKIGSQLPSSRTIATIIGFSANTTRLALEYLSTQKLSDISLKILTNMVGFWKV